ncbi:glycosyltransferase [Pigmentiphaga sp. NML080357]|uniref:glycosyltransferase family protein n=1 Tax=Pigmentiphaga sp. NML080357 TaxID=2008675 RepID=UPI001184D5D3|nr:glycosyltransferase [Pigmentiphaga sp. NML080357]
MTSDEIIFLAPLPAFRKRTRLAKMVKVFHGRGLRSTLLGWERRSGELEVLRWEGDGVSEHTILRGGGYVSAKARAMYPLWMIVVFFTVLRLGKGKTLFCLGWETAFPARVAAMFTKARIVFDDADRFSMLIRLPRLLKQLLVGLEKWTSRKSFLHVVPGWSRYEWRVPSMLLLRNTPLREDFEAARIAAPPRLDVDLVIYVNGWINWDTGSPIFLKALDRLCEMKVNVVMHIAGRVVSESGEALIRHPNVIFHGELKQREALALYPASDIVLTYYDPVVAINPHAESNKWGDCIYFGTPFIVNEEVETAKHFAEAKAAWQVPYQDADGLASLLKKISERRDLLDSARRALHTFRDAYPPYDVQLSEILTRLGIK